MKTKPVIIILGERFDLTLSELEILLTGVSFERVKKLFRQGGEVRVDQKSIKPEILAVI